MMNPEITHALLLVLVAAVVTLALRALPFLIFGGSRKMSPKIKTIADSLPPAIMGVLVIFCLKSPLLVIRTDLITAVISLVSVLAVVLVHLWKKNTLLSIFVGTVIYMILIRVF